MALDKFRSNLDQENSLQQLEKKWVNEETRIRNEILNNFCEFLKSEDFSITKDEFSATAKYGTALLSIEVASYRRVLNHPAITNQLWYQYHIKYNKWGNDVQLLVKLNVLNQPITESREDNHQYGYLRIVKNVNLLNDYIKNFQPIKYNLSAQKENDRSKIGFFGKVFTTINGSNGDTKKANNINEIIEAILNDEFSNSGIW